MNQTIDHEIQILWAGFDKYDVEEKIAAFARLKDASRQEDLPQLIELIKSRKNDFWTRELLSEPICELGGSNHLVELFEALELNREEGHDNDAFHNFLIEIALTDPAACREKINALLELSDYKHKETAEWLLEYCE